MNKGHWNFGGRYENDALAFIDCLTDRDREYCKGAIIGQCYRHVFEKSKYSHRYTFYCWFADGSAIIIDMEKEYMSAFEVRPIGDRALPG